MVTQIQHQAPPRTKVRRIKADNLRRTWGVGSSYTTRRIAGITITASFISFISFGQELDISIQTCYTVAS